MKKTLRDRVTRFIRRRRDDGYKPSALAMELGRGALSQPFVEDGEEMTEPHQIIFTRTDMGGMQMELPTAGHRAQIVPDNCDHSTVLLAQAFGEMAVVPGESYNVVIDEDGNGFSVQSVTKGVSPEMTGAALEAAARQFRYYAAQHEAKGTPEADEKAAVNREMQLLMERALGTEVYAPGKMGFLPIDDSEGGFDVAVENLIERGYENGVSSADMMKSLTYQAGVIADCVVKRDSSDLPTVQDAPETPQESDSALPAPLAPLTSAAAILAWLRGKAEYARKRGDTDIQRILGALLEGIEKDLVDELPVDPESALRQFYIDCHARNVKAGWWNDLATGTPKKRSVGELFVLMVTELAEAYEAYLSKDNDDKLPHLPGLGVELGDVQIRLADFCGALLEGSIVEDSGARNPGDEMFRQIVTIARRYEAIRKTDAAKGEPEEGESIGKQDVAGMTFEKLAFNATRPDHKIENRMKDDGKRT